MSNGAWRGCREGFGAVNEKKSISIPRTMPYEGDMSEDLKVHRSRFSIVHNPERSVHEGGVYHTLFTRAERPRALTAQRGMAFDLLYIPSRADFALATFFFPSLIPGLRTVLDITLAK